MREARLLSLDVRLAVLELPCGQVIQALLALVWKHFALYEIQLEHLLTIVLWCPSPREV